MSTFNQRNVQQILVGGTTNADYGDHLTYGDFVENADAGEMGIFNAQIGANYGARETNGAAASQFFIAVKKSATEVIKSDVIDSNLASTTFTTRDAFGVSQQMTSLGYNGTSGSIDSSLTDNLYFGEVYLQDFITSSGDGRRIKHFQHLSSASGDSQAEIAIQLAGSLTDNMSKEKDKWVTADAILNTAASATNDLTNVATITNGSTQFSVANNLTYNTAAGTLAVGDFIRIAPSEELHLNLGTDDEVTRRYPVYKVTAINALVVTVDRPIAVASGTYADGDECTQVIPAATAAAADAGVIFKGGAQKHTTGKFHAKPSIFEMNFQRGGTTTAVSNVFNPVSGGNDGTSVAQMEWFFQGNEGEFNRMGQPALFTPSALVDTDEAYHIIQISYANSEVVGGFSAEVSPKVLTLAIPHSVCAGLSGGTANYWNETDGVNVVLADLLGEANDMIDEDAGTGADTVTLGDGIYLHTQSNTGDVVTVPVGTEGEFLTIGAVAEAAAADTSVITPDPTEARGFTTVTLADIGSSCTLLFTNGMWEVYNTTGTNVTIA